MPENFIYYLFLVIGVLHSKYYNFQELRALLSQSNISFPLFLSDDNLNAIWDKLIEKYNDKILNNIIFMSDKNGRILKAFHPSLSHWNEFKSFALSIIRRESL